MSRGGRRLVSRTDAGKRPAERQAPPVGQGAPQLTPTARSLHPYGMGAPLDPRIRAEMEARFGQGFGSVRVHDDAAAHDSAERLQAAAYTVGNHVVFNARQYAPDTSAGRRLLAHELAHVVQQRRGGAPPELSPAAGHERGADQAARAVEAGGAAVSVSGATGVGVARQLADEFPKGDAARLLQPGPQYWLEHAPDLASMGAREMVDEANQIQEWLNRQIRTSPESIRLKQVQQALVEAASAKEQRAKAKAIPAPRARKPTRGRAKEAPAAASAPETADTRPRLLREQRSLQIDDVGTLLREYDEIHEYLQRRGIAEEDRETLQLELAHLEPLVARELARRSAVRRADVIQGALTPDDKSGDGRARLIETARRVDRVQPLAGEPGMNYLLSGGEQILIDDEQLKVIRGEMTKAAGADARRIRESNENVQQEWRDFVELTFEEHPYVGFFTMLVARDNPSKWDEGIMPRVIESNVRLHEFTAMHQAAADPWQTGRPPLAPMVEALTASSAESDAARRYFESRRDNMISAAGDIVTGLELTKTAGQFASSIAFGPAGSALYAGGETLLVQGSEILNDQREGFDFYAVGRDAVIGGVANKVTRGIGGLAKPTSSLATRGTLWMVGDRAAAGVSTASSMGLDNLVGRSDHSLGDIARASKQQTLDWKGALTSLVLGRVAARAHRPRVAPPPRPQPVRPATTDAGPPAAATPAPAPRAANDNVPAPAADPALPPPIPLTQAERPPVSAASERLNDLLDRQPAHQVGSVTALRPKMSNPPADPSTEAAAEAVPQAYRMAVGQSQPMTESAPAAQGAAGMQMAAQTPKPPAASGKGASPSGTAAPKPSSSSGTGPRKSKAPLVAVRVTGKTENKGSFVEKGSPDYKQASKDPAYRLMPKDEAEALGFRPEGTPFDRAIAPRMRNGQQVESAGAGHHLKHNIAARVDPPARRATANDNQAASEEVVTRIMGAGRREEHGYNALLDRREYGIRRPTNVSARDVDAITVKLVKGKAYIYLNDITTPGLPKPAKPSHAKWTKALHEAVKPEHLKFGDPKFDREFKKAVDAAIKADPPRVFVRTVRVEITPDGERVKLERPERVKREHLDD
jgi:hypothetical protein